NRWRLGPCCVTHLSILRKPCVSVITDKGTISVTTDHPFLASAHNKISGAKAKWINACVLKEGMKIKYINPWQKDNSWESGYLAGQYDGEGSLVKNGYGICLDRKS